MKPAIRVERLHATLVDCISQPSPQPDLEAVRTFIAQVVKPRLQQLPLDSLDVDDMGNLAAKLRGRDHASPFLFCSYAGTVPAGNMPHPFEPRVVNGPGYGQPAGQYMWGRGTSEQMSALAAGLEALQVYCEEKPTRTRDLIFATTVAGEMGSHEAVEHMMRGGLLADGPALLAVGTNNQVYVGNMGRLDVHVEVAGKACHSSSPSNGRNAIEGARQFLNALREVPLPPPDPDLGQPSLTPTMIASSPAISHTVPDLCSLVLDRRLIPGEEMDEALEDIVRCGERIADYPVNVR